ncbi:MAG TPA: hypothetical protein VFM34_10885 [Moraxellaceae bacterium]|nr:hypothetical protein [Moraxellaceae bacterium]
MRFRCVIVLSVVLAGCSTVEPRADVAPSRPATAPAQVPAPGSPTLPSRQSTDIPHRIQPQRQLADGSQIPAVRGLIGAADSAMASGDVELASVNLERAQRLAPQSSLVYQKLAMVRLRQNRPAEAEQLARKALGFAGGTSQQAALWLLIASARDMQGQRGGAQEARTRAAALQAGTPSSP